MLVDDRKLTCVDHEETDKEEPSGYLPRKNWTDKMVKNHHQHKCGQCGLWKVWIKK